MPGLDPGISWWCFYCKTQTSSFRLRRLHAVDDSPDEQGHAYRQGDLDADFDAVQSPAAIAQRGEDDGSDLLLGGHGEFLSSFSFLIANELQLLKWVV